MEQNNNTLPEEVLAQIEKEAEVYSEKKMDHLYNIIEYNTFGDLNSGYIAGATEYAPWKVKYDELKASYDKLKGEIIQVEKANSGLLFECQELKDRSEKMEHALEFIKAYGPDQSAIGRAFIDKALANEGKEAEKAPIEYMPIHPDDASKFDCPTQFPMHLLDEDQAQRNHGQSLKRLKERGGLSVHEILAVAGKKPYSYYGGLPWNEALKMLNDIVITNPQK